MTEADFFRKKRYFLPEQWIINENTHHYVTYFGSFNLILDLIPSSSNKALDVGCGPGRLSHELIKKGYKVIGIDYSKRAIKFAKILVPNGNFYEIDITAKKAFLKINDKYQLIVLREVLEHVNPKYHKQILDNLFSLLDNQGNLILTVPTKRVYRNPEKHFKHFNIEEIVTILVDSNFRIKKIIGNIRYDIFYKLLFNNKIIEAFITLLSPPIVVKAFNKIYLQFFNKSPPNKCGRLIILAKK